MKIINITLFILFTPIFYICYLISSILKSFINTLTIPFDTQRFANAYIAFFSNAKIIYNGIFKHNQQTSQDNDEDNEEQTSTRRPVGFCCFKSSAPSLPHLPGPPTLPQFPEPGEIEEEYDEDDEIEEEEE